MIKIKSVITALLSSMIAVTSFAQRNPTVSLTLTDKALGYTFKLDKQRISISAYDKTGKLIWKANPMADYKPGKYDTKHPKIWYFAFGPDATNKKNEVICIQYGEGPFGFLDKKTGKFTYGGSD